MSGEIIDVTMEVVEVINLDTNTVETLTGPGLFKSISLHNSLYTSTLLKH